MQSAHLGLERRLGMGLHEDRRLAVNGLVEEVVRVVVGEDLDGLANRRDLVEARLGPPHTPHYRGLTPLARLKPTTTTFQLVLSLSFQRGHSGENDRGRFYAIERSALNAGELTGVPSPCPTAGSGA